MRKLLKGMSSGSRSTSDKGVNDKNAKLVASMALLDSQVLDPAQIQVGQLIGKGAFATVYQCELAGQAAVVKAVASDQLDEEMVYLLTNECTIWAKLAHANIVSFFGMASTPDSIWLVCESMPEGSLDDQLRGLRERHAPPPSDAHLLERFTQIAKGMAYLHKFDPPVLHRDLKSANILVGGHGSRLAIADFGLARFSAGPGQKMTAETGSYRWMAPEVIRHEHYDKPCDVYSYAVLAWEMLTYSVPFANMTPVQAAFAVAKEARRPPLPNGCPLPINHMLSACWHQDAVLRPTFDALCQALEAEKEMLQKAEAEKPPHTGEGEQE